MSTLALAPEELMAFAPPSASSAAVVAGPRLSARAAFQELLSLDAVLVDLRTAAQRAAQGEVAPGLPVVLGLAELLGGRAPSYDRLIVLCADGRSSVAAAEALRRLGVPGATDVVGGFAAWRAAGMPVA